MPCPSQTSGFNVPNYVRHYKARHMTTYDEFGEEERLKILKDLKSSKESVHNGDVDPLLTFFFDEVRFHLHGHVSTQNNRYWATENPHIIHEVPHHAAKVGNVISTDYSGPFGVYWQSDLRYGQVGVSCWAGVLPWRGSVAAWIRRNIDAFWRMCSTYLEHNFSVHIVQAVQAWFLERPEIEVARFERNRECLGEIEEWETRVVRK
ncbi:hypothetical protein ANN_01976 [Periplaneta americana]|uniref:Uncharacterized protein n=1 Tax=Periplaneta americana TaxID=6978 RepID=A0ABQ8TV33_PERAM|nr:hypothetical protein ANN_01976 [Periplaneta americana]